MSGGPGPAWSWEVADLATAPGSSSLMDRGGGGGSVNQWVSGLLGGRLPAGERRSQAGCSVDPSRTYICRPQNVTGSQSAGLASMSYSCWVNTSGGPGSGSLCRDGSPRDRP